MHKHNEQLIDAESKPKEGAQPLSFHKQYARTTTVQVRSRSAAAITVGAGFNQ